MRIDEAGDALINARQKLTQVLSNDFNAYYELGNAHRRWTNVFIMTSQFVSETLGVYETEEIEAMKQGPRSLYPRKSRKSNRSLSQSYRNQTRLCGCL